MIINYLLFVCVRVCVILESLISLKLAQQRHYVLEDKTVLVSIQYLGSPSKHISYLTGHVLSSLIFSALQQ